MMKFGYIFLLAGGRLERFLDTLKDVSGIYFEKARVLLHGFLKFLGEWFRELYAKIPPFKYKDYVIAAVLLLFASVIVFLIVRMIAGLFRVDHFKKGERLMKKEKFERARRHFLKADAFIKAAFCSLKLTKIREAAEYFLLGKEFEMAAKYYALEKDYKRAAEIYEKLGKRIEAAEMYFRDGDYARAASAYRQLKLLKKAEEMYVRLEKFEEIAFMYKQHFDEEMTRLPKNPSQKKVENLKALALKSGQYFIRCGANQKAIEVFLKAQLFKEAVMAYVKMGEYTKAGDVCIQIDDRLKAAQFYTEGKSYEKAISIYKDMGKLDEVADVLDIAGKKVEASELRGRLSLQRKDTELGARHLEEAGKFTEAADLYLEIKKLRKAAELYEKGDNYEKAAEIHERLNNYQKAAELYKAVNRFKSAANCYKAMNDERSYLEMLLLGESYFEASKYYLEKEEEDNAIEVLQKIEPDSPDYRLACNMLGRIFHSRNISGLAREKLLKAIEGKEINKRNLEMFYDVAVFKESHGEESEALKIYEQILSYDFYFKDAQDRRKILEDKLSEKKKIQKSLVEEQILLSGDGSKSSFVSTKTGLVNNRHEIAEEIGRGGMGVVYKAYDRSLDRTVALKFLPHDFTRDARDIEKFINEAKSAAKLNHRNIITIHDIDQVEDDYFIVMEYVDGANLKEIIDLAKNLPFGTIHMVAEQICDALAYAHKNNVIHRDIKNANIMWTNEKIVKIADFGLAKIIEDGLKTSTRVQGSPVYMSPEQVLGKDVDHRTDIYSLGVSLYEMSTGKVPFERGDIGYHHLNTLAEPPEEIRRDIPKYLSDVIKRCLNKRPEDRYQSASELREELSKTRK